MPKDHHLRVDFDPENLLKPLAVRRGIGPRLVHETLRVGKNDNIHFTSTSEFSLFFPHPGVANDNDSSPEPDHPVTGGDVFSSKLIAESGGKVELTEAEARLREKIVDLGMELAHEAEADDGSFFHMRIERSTEFLGS